MNAKYDVRFRRGFSENIVIVTGEVRHGTTWYELPEWRGHFTASYIPPEREVMVRVAHVWQLHDLPRTGSGIPNNHYVDKTYEMSIPED